MTGIASGFQLQEFSEKAWRSIADSDARINIWHGSVRSGKTINSLIAFGLRVASRPKGAQYMMVGKTRGSLERNCIVPLLGLFGEGTCNYSRYGSRMLFAGRTVHLLDANDESTTNRLKGATLADAYGDELTTWPESVFRMLMSRLSMKDSRFYGTTNPDSPGHWLKVHYLDRADELKLKQWQFALTDNPSLPPEYIAAVSREYTGLWYNRYILGQWTMAEGAIFDNITDANLLDGNSSCFAEARAKGDRYLAIDYGTVNAFVALEVYLYNDKLYVTDEYRWDSAVEGQQKTDNEYEADILKMVSHPDLVNSIIVDPSASSFVVQLRRRGFNVRLARNEVLEGIRETAAAFTQGRIVINKDTCAGLVKELQGYRWDPRGTLSGSEHPLKEADHGPDALRYAVATLGLVRKDTALEADIDTVLKAVRIY